MLNEGKVSQQHQREHVRDAEGRSAGFPLTLNTSQCPLPPKKKKEKASVKVNTMPKTRITWEPQTVPVQSDFL